MNSSVSKYVAISAILMIGIFAIPRTVVAAIEYASFAWVEQGVARLRAATFNTTPNDRGVVQSMGVRKNRFTGPGYSILGPWFDQPLDADIVVVVTEHSSSAVGTHCAKGDHRWVSGNVIFLRSSQQKCVPYSGGAGGCAIANPETSILSLSGERATLPAAALNPLTRRGVAEDTRSIVLDEYALVHIGSQGASFKQVSEDFQVTSSLVNTLTSQSSSGVVPVAVPLEAAERQLVDIEGSSRSDRKHLRGGSGAMLVIQHQREHPANESFAPVPHITFTPQVFASSLPAQERRGFAIVDFGESGRILNVHAISESAAPAGSAIAAAISNAVSTQFSDERRHDHRVYLAYEIDGRVLRVAGSPFATMPMCCGPCYGPCHL